MTAARTGPVYLYHPQAMPRALFDRFYREFGGGTGGSLVQWVVDNPGGPFGDSVESYTDANYGDTIQFNLDVDAWLKTVGAAPGETVYFWLR